MSRWVSTFLSVLIAVSVARSQHKGADHPFGQSGETCGRALNIPSVPFQDNGFLGHGDDCAGTPYWDVFYRFTAPVAGNYTASMCNSAGDGYFAIWLNSCCSGSVIYADGGCGDDPQVTFPLFTGQIIYFECGQAFSSPGPEPYVFQLIGPPPPLPCGGTVQISTNNIQFQPTYIGSQSQQSFTVTNSGSNNLCVDSIRSTGHIWSGSPSSFMLGAGLTQNIYVNFAPTFEHDFEGTVRIFSSDPAQNPTDSVTVSGTGCRPATQPPAPRLFTAGSPNDLYFALPWDQNGQKTEYAVEVSNNNFATLQYIELPFGLGNDPDFAPAATWGQYGKGLISGLEPSSLYQVRLRSRDCTGFELPGTAASLATRDSVTMNPFTITIRVVNGNAVELNWDSTLTDISDNALVNFGFSVFAGNRPDSVDEYLGQTTGGSFSIAAAALQKRFFTVEPHLTGAFAGAQPFIAWPPEGATLSGRNTVLIQDFVHASEWDSFRIQIDSASTMVLLGSNFDNTSDLTSRRETTADFRRFTPGPHTITATVVDHWGAVFHDSIHVNIVPRPYVTFDASYDSSRQLFTCDTADAGGITGGLADILWNIEHIDERYGGEVFFPPVPPDSLMIVKPELILEDNVLDESGKWFEDRPGEKGGVTQQTGNPGYPSTTIVCCCTDITLSTTGTSEGEYKHKKNWALGPIVRCAGGQYEVGFAFEWTIHLMLISKMELTWCQWGQDAKGTRVTTVGKCTTDDTFEARERPDSVFKVDPHGLKFPFSDAGFGNDDYRSSKESTWQDWDLKSGLIRGLDIPADVGSIPSGKAVHSVGHNMFLVQAAPECFEPPPIRCCKQFELHWDVTFCQHCRNIIQTVPPHFTDPVTPGACPALVPD